MPRIAVVLLLALAARSLSVQAPSLVGTWRLVSMRQPDSGGRSQHYWDSQPSGRIVYTAQGQMAAQLYDARRPRLGVPWESVDAGVARIAFVGLITYFGSYTVDPLAGTVTHSVEGAMVPDWIGTRLVRGYRFLGPDRVEIREITDANTGRRVTDGTVLVWERIGH